MYCDTLLYPDVRSEVVI